jgi:hypothetical protein
LLRAVRNLELLARPRDGYLLIPRMRVPDVRLTRKQDNHLLTSAGRLAGWWNADYVISGQGEHEIQQAAILRP